MADRKKKKDTQSDFISSGQSVINDLETLFHDILSMNQLTPMDIYVDYVLNQRHVCKEINIHNIYKNYRRINSPEIYNILWSMFDDHEAEYLKNILFLVSLPYIQEQ